MSSKDLDPPTFTLVDSESDISQMVDSLLDLPNDPPSLYIDLEGVNLSRHGSISILQLFVKPRHHAYLVDVHTLACRAFSTAGTNGKTLKDVLESSAIQKVFFDVRSDSDAMYSHFSINLAGIQDVQLMELACRPSHSSKRLLNGLTRCIEQDAKLTLRESRAWRAVKEQGRGLFDPKLGGTYEVFNHRPLDDLVTSYCVQDVQFLPRLWSVYASKMSPSWHEKVQTATQERIALSQSRTFNSVGRHMALGPLAWR